MRYLRCAVVMAAVVALSGGGSTVAAARPASEVGRPGTPASSGFTVTLLSGDRVDVTERAGGRVTTAVRPAPGRENGADDDDRPGHAVRGKYRSRRTPAVPAAAATSTPTKR